MGRNRVAVYRTSWWAAAIALILAGTFAAAVLCPAGLAVAFGVFAAAGGAAALFGRLAGNGIGGVRGARSVLVTGVASGAAAGGLVGLAALMGTPAILLALGVAVASPWATRILGRHVRTETTTHRRLDPVLRALAWSGVGVVPYWQPPPAAPVTDEQLCRAWCESYRTVCAATSASKVIRVAGWREGYLDELERRHPAGLAAWLASGPSADGDPLAYLGQATEEVPPIDWDALIGGQDG